MVLFNMVPRNSRREKEQEKSEDNKWDGRKKEKRKIGENEKELRTYLVTRRDSCLGANSWEPRLSWFVERCNPIGPDAGPTDGQLPHAVPGLPWLRLLLPHYYSVRLFGVISSHLRRIIGSQLMI